MQCTFRVPLDSEIAQFPRKGTQECHFIYCDMHYNYWPGSVPGWKVFGQFVPQLMRGFCTSGNTSGYGIKDTWLDDWYVQSQYIWSTPRTPSAQGRVLAWTGALVRVKPGATVETKIFYSAGAGVGSAAAGVGSSGAYTLQISADGGPLSELVVRTPFMGTIPAFAAPYGSAGSPAEYYRWVLGDLHEAWGMDSPAFYPTRTQWSVRYDASSPADLAFSPRNDCTLHAGTSGSSGGSWNGTDEAMDEAPLTRTALRRNASCAPTVATTTMGAVRLGSADFAVERWGGARGIASR